MKKEKYENIYSKQKVYGTVKCFICQKEIKEYTFCFSECSIFIDDKYDSNTPYFYICLSCGKTPKRSEKVIIPLLKILYGHKIKVVKYNKITNENEDFYY